MTLQAQEKQVKMSYDDFLEQFRPVVNHIDSAASYNGFLFETFGAELAYVSEAKQEHVWTVLDSDGITAVTNGMHFVNALGYFITEVPAQPNTYYDIEEDEDVSDDETDE